MLAYGLMDGDVFAMSCGCAKYAGLFSVSVRRPILLKMCWEEQSGLDCEGSDGDDINDSIIRELLRREHVATAEMMSPTVPVGSEDRAGRGACTHVP